MLGAQDGRALVIVGLIRFGGHLSKGGYDVQTNGRHAPRPRRRFDEEFKAQPVRLVLDEGKSVGSVARDLDLTETALREWVNRARADRTKGRTGLTTAEREELTRLRRENRILQEEREILKKAAAFFAKHQR
jgi:transposase